LSFSINTNTLALGAMNNLDMVNNQLSQSMTRLSTGLQINSAADNPSGLITSQFMTAQIGGMNQAITNGQQGINYAKTADGALSQIGTLLQSAYSLAVASANSATLSSNELQANQQQLSSIVSSITQISGTTQYNGKNLLDGSSGVQSAVTAGSTVAALNIGGTFAGASLTANSTVTLSSLTAATQASVNSQAYGSLTSDVTAGSFTLNGSTFNTSANTTVQDVINQVNQASNQTGVTASWNSGSDEIGFTSNAYGSGASINLVDANGVVKSGGGVASSTGTNAVASVTIGGTSALFTGSQNGNGGLTLEDASGNTLTLATGGNTTTSTAAAVGQVVVGSAQFQVGQNSGNTAQLSIGNFAASNLGAGAVSGLTMNNLDLTTASGASDAMSVIQQAINQVATARGSIGNFQSNVLQVDVNNMTTAQQNLTSSLSTIQDTNVAQEMTNFTKLQILEQSGMAMLSQANSMPQQVLGLIKGG
jgi:flagellin